MTNKELKNLIKNAYDVEPSADKRAFLKQYQKRELHMFDIVKQQVFSTVGISNMLIGLLALFFFWQMMLQMDGYGVYELIRLSGIIPVITITGILGFGRSERYGMDELEMSTRFSLRTVTMARLIVIGAIDALIIAGIIILSGKLMKLELMQTLLIITIPYLVAAWGCLVITRKMHSKKDIGACVVFEACICFVCSITSEHTPWNILFLDTGISYIVIAALCILVGIEINKLVKGDNTKWNLC